MNSILFCRQNFPMIWWYVCQPVGFSKASSLKIEMNFWYFFDFISSGNSEKKTQYFGGFWFFLFLRDVKLICWFGQFLFFNKVVCQSFILSRSYKQKNLNDFFLFFNFISSGSSDKKTHFFWVTVEFFLRNMKN